MEAIFFFLSLEHFPFCYVKICVFIRNYLIEGAKWEKWKALRINDDDVLFMEGRKGKKWIQFTILIPFHPTCLLFDCFFYLIT